MRHKCGGEKRPHKHKGRRPQRRDYALHLRSLVTQGKGHSADGTVRNPSESDTTWVSLRAGSKVGRR